jgi:hypothetical protein
MYAAYSAWQLLQRRRVGLENMLWVCYFAGVLLAIGLGAWLYGGESFSPFYWLAPAWVVFLIWYLRRCRWTVDWVDAGDRHDETRDDDELDARG